MCLSLFARKGNHNDIIRQQFSKNGKHVSFLKDNMKRIVFQHGKSISAMYLKRKTRNLLGISDYSTKQDI